MSGVASHLTDDAALLGLSYAGPVGQAAELEVEHGRLRISVIDASTGLPRQRQAEEGALGGRGLAIVEAMSEDWSVVMRPTGKTVWSQLAIAGPEGSR